MAPPGAAEGGDSPRSWRRLAAQERRDRERRATARRSQPARFRVVKRRDRFDCLAIPSWNQARVRERARREFIDRQAPGRARGNSGPGQTPIALARGRAAGQQGYRVRFTTAAAWVPERREAKEEKRGLRFQKLRASDERRSIEARGLVPLSKTGAELLLEIFSLRSERGATRVTRNRPFNEGTEVRGSERLTGARLDRRTHHVHILEMNGESYRLTGC